VSQLIVAVPAGVAVNASRLSALGAAKYHRQLIDSMLHWLLPVWYACPGLVFLAWKLACSRRGTCRHASWMYATVCGRQADSLSSACLWWSAVLGEVS
jgi:hypothetical protein